jgi:[methyl-Co(III) methanol-specific corrinoid protein]:coenzyme M methyltransferase
MQRDLPAGAPLSPKERLLRALRRSPVDRPPFVCPGGMMSMAVTEVMDRLDARWPDAHEDPALMARLTLGMAELGGLENTGVPFCMTVEAEALGARVELGTRDGEPRVVAYAVEATAAVPRLGRLDPAQGRAAVCVEAVRLLKAARPDLPVIANVVGPVSLATSVVDPTVFFRDVRREPRAAHALLEAAVEASERFGEALVAAGADVVCIADPSATGELLGKTVFDAFALPGLNRLADRFRALGRPTIVHICGRLAPLGTSLGALSAEAVSVDSCVSLADLRAQAAGKATMGNVSTFKLERGTSEEVAEAAEACLRRGADIVAPACGLGPRTPLANVAAAAGRVVGAAAGADGGAACRG